MSALAGLFAELAGRIAELSAAVGRRAQIDLDALTDRSDDLDLADPGRISPNGACRLVQAADGWIAVNLARADDQDLVPAWLQQEAASDPWAAVEAVSRDRPWRELVAGARVLGMPVAGVGEVSAPALAAPLVKRGAPGRCDRPLRAVDLSTLWAGPLCGAVLAAAGFEVVKVESRSRPDPSRLSTPAFWRRLNGAKAELQLDFASPDDRRRLRDLMLEADLVITSARPRAFDQLGLAPQQIFDQRPGLTWVAISGYGWTGEAADRVAFGDDAAAAGGLVRWTADGAPEFMGDALGDPLTGLAAAAGALEAVRAGGGVLVDAALARCAAGAAAELGLAA